MIDQLPFDGPLRGADIWGNEYFSRNAVHDGAIAAGIAEDDVMLFMDVDELPHPRALLSIRALYSFSPQNRKRVFKLTPLNFIYDFSCYVGDDKVLSTGAAAAATFSVARQLGVTVEIGHPHGRHYVSATRMYLQTINPYPFQIVLNPGTWHLSFFGGVDRIRRKLESYSHQQNIVSRC